MDHVSLFYEFYELNFFETNESSIESKDAYSPFVLEVAKIPPFAILIALFLILFGFALQIVEFISKK